jgi:hypothetical protein
LDVEDTFATAGKERAQKDIGEIAALNGRAAPYIGQRPFLLERLRSSILMRWHWALANVQPREIDPVTRKGIFRLPPHAENGRR